MESFLQPKIIIPDIHQSIRAEVRLAMFIICHNFTQFIEGEFKESAFIEKVAWGRAKMAAFASCIGNHLKMELVSDMKNSSFSFMVDPSNDTEL